MNPNTHIKLLLARHTELKELEQEVNSLQLKITELDPLQFGQFPIYRNP